MSDVQQFMDQQDGKICHTINIHEACLLLIGITFVSDMTGGSKFIIRLSFHCLIFRDPSIIRMDSLYVLGLLFAFQPPPAFVNAHNHW